MEELIDTKTETRARDAETVVELFSNGGASRLHLQAKKLQTQVITEMAAIDSERARTTEQAWTRFLQLAAHSRSRPLYTLDEYLPCRIIDAGELIWFGTLTFGMALSIRNEELELCMELARPGYAAISLTNDLYSWNKEREEAQRAGLDYVYNAIWVIMHERSVGEEEAKRVCVEQIRYYIEQYCQIVEKAKRCGWLSDDLKAYLEAVKASHVGNLVWSIYCPRYHAS
ncbi:isoprenoid synthase domain-containing protein [Aspergillus recurvatus]